ncbi:MAG: Nif3-like dinuclear metal center hexameric protein [Oscillospiraceae bacterium]|nr:Nif3-like dinuclear metal center hexameric protein [Oscillospiraceae bacterium]
MPTVWEIEQAIFQWAPKETAMQGDNVGHLIGDQDRQVQRVLVALDIVGDVVHEAVDGGYDLIVSHHPIMNCTWSPVQTIRDDNEQGRMLLSLIRNNVSAICMHTNLDAAAGGVNDVLAAKLGLQNVSILEGGEGVVRVGELAGEMPLPSFLSEVKGGLVPNGLRYVDGGKPVRRVAVGGGACGEFFACAAANGCDTFVTSDVKYNQFLDAKALGLNLIDAGHFPTEDPVCEAFLRYLADRFPQLTIQKSHSHREIIQYFI